MKKYYILLFCLIVIAIVSCKKEKSFIETEEQVISLIFDKSSRSCPNCEIWNLITVTDPSTLKATIENAFPCTVIKLPAGNYNVTSEIYINKKCHLKIIGAGMGITTLLLTTNVYNCFNIQSDVHDLEICNMSIIGPAQRNPNQGSTAIGSNLNVTNITDMNYHHLYIHNLVNGICLGGNPENDPLTTTTTNFNAWVHDNILEDIFRYTDLENGTGNGYGINNDNVWNVVIENNIINRAGRHSIYQGRGRYVRISNNLILNHDFGQSSNNNWTALSVCRSSYITVENNSILRCNAIAMGMEKDNYSTVANIGFINNRLFGIQGFPTGPYLSGLYTDINSYDINAVFTNNIFLNYNNGIEFFYPGNGVDLSGYQNYPYLPTIKIGAYYYYVKYNILYKANYDYNTMTFSPISSYHGWPNVVYLTGGKVGSIDKIYLICNGILYEINQNPWSCRYNAGSAWTATQAIAFAGGFVFIMHNGILYRVNPINWSTTYSNANWFNFQGLTAWNSNLYIMQNNVLHKIDINTLNYQIMDPRSYSAFP